MKRGYRSYKLLGLFILLFSLTLIGLPALLVRGCSWSGPPQARQQGPLVRLQLQSGQVVTLPLDEYLIGVVAAEMPAEFHPEALKAQAVAARTYTLLRLSTKNRATTSGADLSADPENCQAWIPVSEMRRRWGMLCFGYYYGKIAAAVRDTDGEAIVYQGRLIDPVYSASCGGQGTEDAASVWGYDVPYLKGVPCDWDPLSSSSRWRWPSPTTTSSGAWVSRTRQSRRAPVLGAWSGFLTAPPAGGSRTCRWRAKPSRPQTSESSSTSAPLILQSGMQAAGLPSRPWATGMQWACASGGLRAWPCRARATRRSSPTTTRGVQVVHWPAVSGKSSFARTAHLLFRRHDIALDKISLVSPGPVL